MSSTSGRNRLGWVFIIAVIYVVVGFVTAALAGSAASVQGRSLWRAAAWLLSFVVFAGHVWYDRIAVGSTAGSTARHAAAAVALGALLLAVVGPVRGHWAAPDFWRTAVLSLAVWPLLTGIPAFVVAFVAGSLFGQVVNRTTGTVSERPNDSHR